MVKHVSIINFPQLPVRRRSERDRENERREWKLEGDRDWKREKEGIKRL